ncbi:hypothetical protein K9M74_05560, partial [Candidatus Woesearchaeota archaeon]|nr:hypothetical protein [Candidatus Woesearchaeota archaeon]
MSLQELANSLSAVERKVLPHLTADITTTELVVKSGLQDVEVKRALMWLSNRNVVSLEHTAKKVVVLGTNGELAKEHGLPEIRILTALMQGPKLAQALESDTLPRGEIMACIGILKSHQAATVEKTDQGLIFSILPAGKVLVEQPVYQPQIFFSKHKSFPLSFDELSNDEKEMIKELSKRKDMLKVEEQKEVLVHVTVVGKQLLAADIDTSNIEEQLTVEMLKTGSWQGKIFRTYDVQSPVPRLTGL